MRTVNGETVFTREEFDRMVEEVTSEDQNYDTLYKIVEKTVGSSVRNFCNSSKILKGGAYEHDIMAEVQLRVIQTVVTGFLKREELGGRINNDPLGFQKWLFVVAKSVMITFLKKEFKRRGASLEDEGVLLAIDKYQFEIEDADIEKAGRTEQILERAVDKVLSSESKPYTVLSWLAYSVYVVLSDTKKVQISNAIVEQFSDKTLYEMRDNLFSAAAYIPWMKITSSSRKRIDAALDEDYDDFRTYGEVDFNEFYMKKGGKASVSDWINKANNIIKKQVETQ